MFMCFCCFIQSFQSFLLLLSWLFPDGFSCKIGCYSKNAKVFFFLNNTFHMSLVRCLGASFSFTLPLWNAHTGSCWILRDHIPILGFFGNAQSVLPLCWSTFYNKNFWTPAVFLWRTLYIPSIAHLHTLIFIVGCLMWQESLQNSVKFLCVCMCVWMCTCVSTRISIPLEV